MLSVFVSMLMIACGCSSGDGLDGSGKGSLKLSKMDLSGAQSLAIAGSDSRADNSTLLYKIDEAGNLTAVKVEMIVTEGGETKSVSTDYSVHPEALIPIGDRYVYMYMCYFYDPEGNPTNIEQYYEDGNSWDGVSILVNKKSGKIYYIPQTARNYFPKPVSFGNDLNYYNNDIVVADDGTFYMQTSAGAVKVVISDDNATVSTFGPQNQNVEYEWNSWTGGGLIPLKNGAVISIPGYAGGWHTEYQKLNVLYQNGGFETFDGSNNNWHGGLSELKDEYTFLYTEGKVLAVKRPVSNFKMSWADKGNGFQAEKYDSEDVELSLVEVNVGSSYGNITVGTPFFILKGTNYVWKDYTRPAAEDWTEYARQMGGEQALYSIGDYYMIGNVLAIKKNTSTYRDLVKEGISEHVIIPTKNNVYKGKSWYVYLDCADWFDPETLTYGRVSWDYPEHRESEKIDIANGVFTIVFLNPADGSRTMRTINIETGDYKDSPVQTTQKIIQLIPMN